MLGSGWWQWEWKGDNGFKRVWGCEFLALDRWLQLVHSNYYPLQFIISDLYCIINSRKGGSDHICFVHTLFPVSCTLSNSWLTSGNWLCWARESDWTWSWTLVLITRRLLLVLVGDRVLLLECVYKGPW